MEEKKEHTDIDRLNPNALFYVRSFGAVADLVWQNFRLAEGIHESGTSGARGAWRPRVERKSANKRIEEMHRPRQTDRRP